MNEKTNTPLSLGGWVEKLAAQNQPLQNAPPPDGMASSVAGRNIRRRTPEYETWRAMKERCNNPNSPSYKNYGGRGIRVCERWNLFGNFFADMGQRPLGYTIERKDNNSDYTPENCKWATAKEQSENKRTNRLLTLDGRQQTLSQWAAELGVRQSVLGHRLGRLGWDVEKTLSTPLEEKLLNPEQEKEITERYQAGAASQRALAKAYGVSRGVIKQVLN